MFRTQNFPPVDGEGPSIVVSSLTPSQSPPHPLNFQTMYQQEYKSLKRDLKKTVLPKEGRNLRSPPPRILERKKTATGEYTGVHFEPKLYSPLESKEFSVTPGRTKISPSELVLLRAKHKNTVDQIELDAAPVTFTMKRPKIND